MKAQIHITLKQGVLDPQGNAIAHALHHLGFKQV
ncbi:MAG: phosphoribosylformylglycinamidine synthase subunit PurS, partial [Richelia sp. SL_2_1]|nr:phosphoribosylformylglycinamidine synthase subunit PurS [Richelia sp. SL_2_1]